MTTVARSTRAIAVLLAILCHPVPAVLASQPPGVTATSAQTPPSQDPEAQGDRAAPVLVGGEPVIWVTVGVGPYTPQLRADRIGERLHAAIRDRSLRDPTVTVTENEGSSELRAGSRLLMVVTQQDARSLGASRAAVAEQYAREFESVIRAERLRYAPGALIRAGVFGLLATLALAGVLWLIRRLARARNAPSTAGERDARERSACSRRKSSPLTGLASPSRAPSVSLVSC